MADFYSREMTGVIDGTVSPPKKADARKVGRKMRSIQATFDLASQAAGSFLVIGRRPAGSAFCGVDFETDTSLGSTTVAVGSRSAPARDKAAAVFTATETPTPFGLVASKAADPITADEIVGITTAAASLPASGILIVEYFYATNN